MTVETTATATATRPADRPEPGTDIVYPTKRDEAWRYAPHRDLERLAFGPTPASTDGIAEGIETGAPAIDGPRIVVVNGRFDPVRSDLDGLPDGVSVSSLAAASEERPAEVAAHFTASPDDDAFVMLNRAHGRDGASIHVDAGCRLDEPIHLIEISEPRAEGDATSTGVVIHVGAGASAAVVETQLGAGASFGGSNRRSTISLGAEASLDHVVLQDLPDPQIQLTRIEVRQLEGSRFRTRAFNLGAGYGRIDYQVELAGEGALADLGGLYVGRGEQTLDQQITVFHHAADCTSRQGFRGILDDRSTGVFNGGINVSPGADGTDAEQANDNLLLSRRAEANTQPRLEILADEVACKHGATVGQLDDNALYYLRSRGIGADEARRLLIAGFADQIVDEVEILAVRQWVSERLGHGTRDADA